MPKTPPIPPQVSPGWKPRPSLSGGRPNRGHPQGHVSPGWEPRRPSLSARYNALGAPGSRVSPGREPRPSFQCPNSRSVRDGSLERILNAARRESVPIGKCTPDIEVRVHRKAASMYRPPRPHLAGVLAVPTRTRRARCRSGTLGHGRERPRPSGSLDRHRGVKRGQRI